MTVRKNFKLTILTISLIVILLFLTACNPGSQPPTQPDSPDFFSYKVLLETKDTNDPIKNVEVKLDIPGSEIIISEYTDDDGFVLFNIENRFENEIANLTVNSDDHISEIHKITLLRGARSKRILLEKVKTNIELVQTPIPSGATATIVTPATVEPATISPIPQTPTTLPTNTPTTTPTSVPTNTPTNIPSLTPAPISDGLSIKELSVLTTLDQQELFTGPSIYDGVLAVLYPDSNAIALLRTSDSKWYYVRLANGKEGWIEAITTILIDGTSANLSVATQQAPTTTRRLTTPLPLLPNCVSTWVDNPGDDIRIYWNAIYPENTEYLLLQVMGQSSPGIWREKPLIEQNKLDITDLDTVKNGFLIGGWKFDAEAFPENNLYEYTLSAHRQDGTRICIIQEQFSK